MILSTTKPDDQGSNLRVGLVTTHIPIGKIKENLSKKKIIEKIHSFHSSLENLWGINNPKIGVEGLLFESFGKNKLWLNLKIFLFNLQSDHKADLETNQEYASGQQAQPPFPAY